MSTLDNFKETFREEAQELLLSLESNLLELETSPADAELLSAVFRVMHTIKGSASMFGFEEISAFTHEVENFFDMVRNGEVDVDRDVINATLSARDLIREMLESEEPDADREKRSAALLAAFRTMAGSSGEKIGDTPGESEKEEEKTYRIRFVPDEDIFLSGTNPILLLKELKELGDCTIVPFLEKIEGLENFNPEKCYCGWDIIITTVAGLNTLKDIFIFIEAESVIQIEPVESFSDMIEEEGSKRLGEILLDRGVIEEETLRKALGNQKKLGEVLIETNLVSKSEVNSALKEQQHNKRLHEKRMEAQGAASTIRVASEKLDSLVDLVGELVTVQARIGQISTEDTTGTLRQVAEQLERLVEELRDNTMSLRMVPIGIAFSKFRRLVMDLSLELGKNVDMAAEGAETELDKTVIEQLGDPLVHLIRNSIDHGIEMPEVRKALGKPEKGTVLLSARHAGANVQIAIKDDGAGLDRETIYNKAVSQGLIAPSADLSDEELYQVIFQPGFSTAKTVTSVSGRGVGMDVVKRQIESLRGTVSIRSRKGAGSTITITLPLTLAIVDGLLVRVGSDFFVVPLSSVEACVELNENDHIESGNRRLIEYREKLLPYVRIDTLFSMPSDESELRQVVVAELDQNRFGIVVDEVIGDHQTVIKSLGPLYRNVRGISGATILGDGRVALILDIMQLARISVRGAGRN